MSTTQQTDSIDIRTAVSKTMDGQVQGSHPDSVYRGLTTEWGLPEVVVGPGGQRGVPISALKEKAVEEPEWLEERYGTRHPFVAAAMTGPEYDPTTAGGTKTERAINSLFDPTGEDETVRKQRGFSRPDDPELRTTVDDTLISAAAPVEVDPVIVDVQRSAAPELQVVQTVAQPGFSYQYNVLSSRDSPLGYLDESQAHGDLSTIGSTPQQSFTLSDETVDHVRHVGLVKVADFAQRAMTTLDYMDPRETALGQAVIAHTLQKARAMFYGDPDATSGNRDIEDADAPRGLARFAEQAGNTVSKSSVSSGFLEDLLDEATDQIQDSGLTWDRARFFVSPKMMNAVYDEITPVVRIDGYDADVEFGPRGFAIATDQGSIPLTMAPNIRSYSGFSGLASNSDPGDVFLVDDLALQIRQLAPMSTVNLGRTGLAERLALFEFYSFVDKSLDVGNSESHTLYLQAYDI